MVYIHPETANALAVKTEVHRLDLVQLLGLVRLQQRQHETANIFRIERRPRDGGQVSGDAQHDGRACHQQNIGRAPAGRLLQYAVERCGALRPAGCATGGSLLTGGGAI